MHTPPPTLDIQFQFIKSNITVLEPQVCDSTGADVVFECTPVCFTEPAKENHMKEYCQVAWVSQGWGMRLPDGREEAADRQGGFNLALHEMWMSFFFSQIDCLPLLQVGYQAKWGGSLICLQ